MVESSQTAARRDPVAEEVALGSLHDLNRTADDWGLSDAVLRECGSSFFEQRVAEMAALRGDDRSDDIAECASRFKRLCGDAPHIPRFAMEAFSLAYSVASMYLTIDDGRWGSAQDQARIAAIVASTAGAANGAVLGAAEEIGRRSEATQDDARARAVKAAAARHAENRQLRDDVLRWYASAKAEFGNKDAAALAATKRVPIAFSTARDWLKNA